MPLFLMHTCVAVVDVRRGMVCEYDVEVAV